MFDVALLANLIVGIVFAAGVCGGLLRSRAVVQFLLSLTRRMGHPQPGKTFSGIIERSSLSRRGRQPWA